MAKPDLAAIPSFYHTYVQMVAEDSVIDALNNNAKEATSLFQHIPEEKWSYRYAEEKWSISEVVQHLIDSERIFGYRALCFARGEEVSLPGFDEKKYAAASEADRRSKDELIAEYKAVREATILLFRSFSPRQYEQTGTANNKVVSVNAIGFISAGHSAHHLKILAERYLS